jgi:SAM-dependent methyltransferase
MGEPVSARSAYDRIAAVYDEHTAENDYEQWLGEILLPEAEKHGLRKGWALDVGCGTGRAFGPLLDRGWQIVGCDVSPAMLDEAERKFKSQVQLHTLDARSLPPLHPGSESSAEAGFDLILSMNDVLNYITDYEDLKRAFEGIKGNLGDGGIVLFDVNTLTLFRENFTSGVAEGKSRPGRTWRGLSSEVQPNALYEAQLSGRGVEPHVHRQRHWTIKQVSEALAQTGLCVLAVLGQHEEAGRIVLSDPPDEQRDVKVIFIATHED